MENSHIEWTHHTLNPWIHCVEVSPGCDNCYAREMAKRFQKGGWGVQAPVWFPKWERVLSDLGKWNRAAEKAGERHRVFVMSMGDIFELLPEEHPQRYEMNALRTDLFLRLTDFPNLDFLLLTKRIGNVVKFVPPDWARGLWPENVWLGISVVNQEEADRDIPKLIRLPAPIRFLSCEPLLGPISLHQAMPCTGYYCDPSIGHIDCKYWSDHLHLVICGGESGPKARPMHPAWAQSLRDQCVFRGVPYFFKQWGRYLPEGQWESVSPDKAVQDCWRRAYDLHERGIRSVFVHGHRFYPMAKSEAGRLLDGQEWSQMPEVSRG